MTNTNGNGSAATRNGLPTISTKTHGDGAFDVERIGVVDGVTTHDRPLTIYVSASGTRADVLAVGKSGQTYVATTPRPTDATTPKLTVNGTVAKITSYERNVFPAHGSAPNTAARKIATRKLVNPTLMMADGTHRTLDGTWYVVAMVKTLKTGRKLECTRMVKSDTLPIIPCVNG